MMLTFVFEDFDIKVYLIEDPIFDGLVGVQMSADFLTVEMVEHMKSVVTSTKSDMDMCDWSYPLSSTGSSELLYEFASIQPECKGGETCRASYTTLLDS